MNYFTKEDLAKRIFMIYGTWTHGTPTLSLTFLAEDSFSTLTMTYGKRDNLKYWRIYSPTPEIRNKILSIAEETIDTFSDIMNSIWRNN